MKVFIVMRNDKIDQVFFNTDPAVARTAAGARVRELTAKWAITRIVEREVIEVGGEPVLADVSANLAYGWVSTGHWDLQKFNQWLDAKHIEPNIPYLRRWNEDGQADAQLVYQQIKTKCWQRWQFIQWLNSFV